MDPLHLHLLLLLGPHQLKVLHQVRGLRVLFQVLRDERARQPPLDVEQRIRAPRRDAIQEGAAPLDAGVPAQHHVPARRAVHGCRVGLVVLRARVAPLLRGVRGSVALAVNLPLPLPAVVVGGVAVVPKGLGHAVLVKVQLHALLVLRLLLLLGKLDRRGGLAALAGRGGVPRRGGVHALAGVADVRAPGICGGARPALLRVLTVHVTAVPSVPSVVPAVKAGAHAARVVLRHGGPEVRVAKVLGVERDVVPCCRGLRGGQVAVLRAGLVHLQGEGGAGLLLRGGGGGELVRPRHRRGVRRRRGCRRRRRRRGVGLLGVRRGRGRGGRGRWRGRGLARGRRALLRPRGDGTEPRRLDHLARCGLTGGFVKTAFVFGGHFFARLGLCFLLSFG
mmetsp:Transcript_2377/g.8629  ORF Transcript_2377/g.8629 Transcript_2377/m.8629 type:complete len:392 (+) Transcript_2377:166-1341(+)